MAGINYTKHLEMTFDDTEVHCDLTTAQLVDEPEGAETLTTFCGSQDIPGSPKYSLNISGFQSGSTAENVFDLIHASYITEPEPAPIAVVLTVGSKTRSFDARPLNDSPFGGDSGSAMTADIAMAVIGEITDGTVTP
jgi:hypothetical protein